MASQVCICPCGNTKEPLYKGATPNGFEGIYFVVGQPQPSPTKPEKAKERTPSPKRRSSPVPPSSSQPTTVEPTAPVPPPPRPPTPPPAQEESDLSEGENEDGGFNVKSAIMGFFKEGGKAKLRKASERKLAEKKKSPPKSKKGGGGRGGVVKGSSSEPGQSASPVVPEEEETVDHADLIANAVKKRVSAFQGEEPEDPEDESTVDEWMDQLDPPTPTSS